MTAPNHPARPALSEAEQERMSHHQRMMLGYMRWGEPSPIQTDEAVAAWADECNLGVLYVLDCIRDGIAERRAALIHFDMAKILSGRAALAADGACHHG